MERITYLNRYQLSFGPDGRPIEQHLASGDVAYRAVDIEAGGQEVAVQLVPTANLQPNAITQLEAEAAAAKQITHLNFPRIYDFGRHGDNLVYVSEYLDGTTAEDWVMTHGPMPIGAALRIAAQVVNALGAATFHGIVHHAVNPRNILLVPGQTPDGEWPLVKVLNFIGVTPRLSATPSGTSEQAMSKFASPEQLLSGTVDFRSQLYSLGATVWFLVKGAPPARGAALKRNNGLPKPAAALLAQMLASDPNARPQDPLAFQGQIRECLELVERREAIGRRFGLPVANAVAAASEEPPQRGLLKPLALAAAVLVLAGLSIAMPAHLRPTRWFASEEEPIGVPVGVPESAALAAATQPPTPVVEPTAAPVTNVARNTQPTAPTPAIVAQQPVATATPQVASTNTSAPSTAPLPEPETAVAAAPTTDSTAYGNPPDIAPADAAPAVVARNTAPEPQLANAMEPAQATQSSEPAPPAEGPREVAQSTTTADTTNDRVVSATTTDTSAKRIAARPATKQPSPAATTVRAAKTTKAPKRIAGREVRRAARVDEDRLPALPPRSKRARFVGTAPDGALMFEMPSEERVYMAAPAYVPDDSSRRRRLRRPIQDLPVLPAEPVFDDELPEDE